MKNRVACRLKRVMIPLISGLFCFTLVLCSEYKSDGVQAGKKDAAAIQHSSFVPDGYRVAFHDEFDSIELDTSGDGSAPWAPWWVGWDVHYLEGNGDRAWKCDASYTNPGTPSLGINLHEAAMGPYLVLFQF